MPEPPAGLVRALAGRYAIERELGQGGMAVVYLAEDLKHGRQVAIKVLRAEFAAAVGTDRFLREIRLTARLDHPHILPLFDSGSTGATADDGFLYYVMPYLAEGSLRDRLAREPRLSLEAGLRLAADVADALAFAQARDVVHRDIKPENILLAAGHARVADFGIARALDPATTQRLTEVGLAVGTPAYMSPEQGLGQADLDTRSDLYALGCVLHELLTGAVPGAGPGGLPGMLVRRLAGPPAPVRAAHPELPVEVDDLLRRLLAPDRDDRPATAEEVQRALARAAAHAAQGGTVTAAPAAAPGRSVAVLPFVNMSADRDNEYFSDGITEELISVLTRSPGLRVAARSSVFAYKGRSEDARKVGDALGVDLVLSGSVRKAGDRIRLAVQLTTVADGYQVWAETFDRELRDVFAVQDEISRAIAGALQLRLTTTSGPGAGRRGTGNVEAYNHYLRGRFHWGRRTEAEIHKAIAHFEQALALDPAYALAEIGVADACNILGFYDWLHPREAFPRALAAAERALALDPSLAAAYCSRAYVRLYHEWRWADAEADFQRALALAPEYVTAWHQYGNLLVARGRFAEASEAMRRAVASEPLSLIANAAVGWGQYYAGDHAGAIAQQRATIELDPTFLQAHLWLGQALLAAGDAVAALAEFDASQRLAGWSAILVAARARALAVLGRPAEVEALVAELDARGRERFIPQYDIAAVFAAAAAPDAAFARLERALAEREHELVFLAVDPAMAALRDDPRFTAIAGRVGL